MGCSGDRKLGLQIAKRVAKPLVAHCSAVSYARQGAASRDSRLSLRVKIL